MYAMTYEPAKPSNLTKRQVSAIAEGFAADVGYQPGDDIHELIHRLGGKIVIEDTLLTDPERSGSLFVEAEDDFRIILPAHTGSSRDRFTLAHELGHYVLHYLCDDTQTGRMMALRRGSDRIEWEANWFAAAFLMPAEQFTNRYNELDGNLSQIADEFGVSLAAAEVRARGLGLTGNVPP
jgi:Zn-dependent peptidase ImmA (M78 family)